MKRCGGDCLLQPGHEGFHKSNHHAWPNEAESLDHWADIGRRLLLGEMPGRSLPWLSKRELDYALEAAGHMAAEDLRESVDRNAVAR